MVDKEERMLISSNKEIKHLFDFGMYHHLSLIFNTLLHPQIYIHLCVKILKEQIS